MNLLEENAGKRKISRRIIDGIKIFENGCKIFGKMSENSWWIVEIMSKIEIK